MEKAVEQALEESLRSTPQSVGEDRHTLGRRIQTQDLSQPGKEDESQVRYDGSDLVVLAFEGTGSYHPRKAQIAQAAAAFRFKASARDF